MSAPSRGALVACAALAATAGLVWYANEVGAFRELKFDLRKLPKGTKFLVKGYRGDYSEAKPHINALPVETEQIVAIYWDDPRLMGNRCRYSIGIVCGKQPEVEAKLKSEGGWTECEIESDLEILYCAVPYTGTVSGIVASIRVYPAWVEEAKKRGKAHGPIVKVTSKKAGLIEFNFLTMPPPPSSFSRAMDKIA